MALRVWLPLDGTLENKGISDVTIGNGNYTIENSGKIGKCIKTSSNSSINGIDLGYNGNIINTGSLSLGGWFKFNQSEISTAVMAKTFTSSASSSTGNLIGNDSYGGIGLIWNSNNIYNSNAFSSMTVFAALRTPTVNQNTTSITIEFDKWVHLFLTWDRTTKILSFYKDGILINSKTFTDFSDAVSRNFLINYAGIYGGNGPGTLIPYCINDLRIYDHCLSQKEIKEISQGLILHYKLDGWSGGAVNNILLNTNFKQTSQVSGWDTTKNGTTVASSWGGYNSGVSNQATVYHAHLKQFNNEWVYEYIKTANESWLGVSQGGLQTKIIAGKTYTFSWEEYHIDGTNRVGTGLYYYKTDATSANFHLGIQQASNITRVSNQWQKFSYTFTAPSDADYTKNISWYIYGHYNGNGTFYMRHPKLEESEIATSWTPTQSELGIDATKIPDSSGYGRNGTITGTLTTQQNSDRYNVSLYFNGSSYITVPNPWKNGSIVTEFTHTAWIKWNNNCSTSAGIHSIAGANNFFRFSLGKSNKLWAYGLRSSLDGETTSAAGLGQYGSTTSLVNGQWYFIAVTFKDGVCKCYCDGELVGTVDNSATYPALKSTIDNLYIGSYNVGSEPAIGNIADSRMYCTALSADDILDLYHTPANVDNLGNLHGFEFIEDDTKDSIYKNGIVSNGSHINYLVNNFAETNTMTDWTFGGTSPTISNGIVTLTGTSPNVTSKNFTVNPDDIIVIEIGVQLTQISTTSGAGIYLGTRYGQSTTRFGYNFTTNEWTVGSSNDTNPYFMYGYNSLDYYHCRTYLLGSNRTIDDIPVGNATNTRALYALKLNSDTVTNIRSGYNSNTEMIIKLSDFKIYNIKEHGIIQSNNSAKTGYGYLQYNGFIEK